MLSIVQGVKYSASNAVNNMIKNGPITFIILNLLADSFSPIKNQLPSNTTYQTIIHIIKKAIYDWDSLVTKGHTLYLILH